MAFASGADAYAARRGKSKQPQRRAAGGNRMEEVFGMYAMSGGKLDKEPNEFVSDFGEGFDGNDDDEEVETSSVLTSSDDDEGAAEEIVVFVVEEPVLKPARKKAAKKKSVPGKAAKKASVEAVVAKEA